jgi:nicotinamidase-related amidase
MSEVRCLVAIDIQEGFHDPCWGERNNPYFESRAESILRSWRNRDWPIVHVQHHSVDPQSPLHPSRPGVDFMEVARPFIDERIFHKQVNSAFIGTALESWLRERGFDSLTFIGLTSDHCVSTSVRMAANLGFDVQVISDATATFSRVGADGIVYSADTVHDISLASLRGEFARIVDSEEVFSF